MDRSHEEQFIGENILPMYPKPASQKQKETKTDLTHTHTHKHTHTHTHTHMYLLTAKTGHVGLPGREERDSKGILER